MDDQYLARLRTADPTRNSSFDHLDPALFHRLRDHTLATAQPPRAAATRGGPTDVDTLDELMGGTRHPDATTGRDRTPVTALARGRRTSSASRRWAVTALAGAAAAAAVALAVPLVSAPSASAEEVLLVTAESAGEQPDLTAGATHWYVSTQADAPDTEPFQVEVWYSRDQPTLQRDGAFAAGYLNGGVKDPTKVRTEELTNSEGDEQSTSTWFIGGDSLTWRDLEALPTDPDELDALIRREVAGNASDEDGEVWSTIGGLLRSPASPALRQTLWEVAARIPDVELVGPMTDAAGRQGTAIERDQTDENRYNEILVLDPGTGALLERRDVAPDGTVDYRETELVSEPTEIVPEPDPPLCGPNSQPQRSC